jgi:hypothetical protein
MPPAPGDRAGGETETPRLILEDGRGALNSNERKIWMSLNIRTPDSNQANKVFDEADPDRHGVIVKAGSEVTEVRYDDGAERNIPNAHLRPVEIDLKKPADGLCQHNPSSVSDVVRLGQEAMARKRRAWEDWLAIAEALQAGRVEVTDALHTNDLHGRRFEKAMGEWLITHGFKEIDKGARNRVLECLKHKIEIEKWRARLTDSERWKFNHPDTVLKKWKASTVVRNPSEPKLLSPMQKLKDSLALLQEDNDRMRREIEDGGGDLWTPEDRPKDIAKIILGKLTKAKAEKVAREILAALKEKANK